MHALLLDADIGPSLQVYKLPGIKKFAARQELGELNSAQLELLNLVGDGRGVDALTRAEMARPQGHRGAFHRLLLLRLLNWLSASRKRNSWNCL
jgi:hypothetical protein